MGAQVVTTVVTPASTFDLVQLSDVKLELKIPSQTTADDAWLAKKITSVSKTIAKYCNRTFPLQTYQDLFFPNRGIRPFHSIGRFPILQLAQWPVTGITSIVVAPGPTSAYDVTLTADVDYYLDGDPGQVIRLSELTGLNTEWQAFPTTVIYQAGFEDIPEDLQDVALQMVAGRYQTRGINPMTKRINQPTGIGELEYWVPNTPQGAFPPAISEVLDFYRVPVNA